MGRLLQEIRAHRLDRLAAAYAVGGWILVQGASILLPTFAAPLWLLRIFIVAVVVGFPVALASGWVLARHSSLAPVAIGPAPWGKTFVALLAIGVVAAAVLSGAGYYLWRVDSASPGITLEAAAALPAPNSIAVLPFVNMSGDPKREYFSDGISEELLNDLANTPALLVAARTSSFAFKGRAAGV